MFCPEMFWSDSGDDPRQNRTPGDERFDVRVKGNKIGRFKTKSIEKYNGMYKDLE